MTNTPPRKLEQLLQANRDLQERHAQQIDAWKSLAFSIKQPDDDSLRKFRDLDPQFE